MLAFYENEDDAIMGKEKAGICYVVGAGENDGLHIAPQAEDYVVAADAGFLVLEQKGIRADVVIGDFDTLGYVPEHPHAIALQPEKDDTDMAAAVNEGIKAGYETFHIYCGMGGRIEHTIANMQLLAKLSKDGKQGFLLGKDSVITAITDGEMAFEKDMSGYLSVFAHSDRAEGVYLKGLKYELEDAELTNVYPLGVSNEFIGKESLVSVRKGTLFLIFPPNRSGKYALG